MVSKISKACDISPKVRKEVYDRDGCCIVCGTTRNLQVAHFIGRGRLGLGIPQNLGMMCIECHRRYDNGDAHKTIEIIFENHLKNHYKNWSKDKLVYHKHQIAPQDIFNEKE